MTSRKSSGSRREDSSVEPVRSQNITVSCRRSDSAPTLPSPASGGGGREGAAEGGDGVEQPPAMANQADAEILQILGRQARQYPRVDLVRAERRLVLTEPKTAQPFRDIHRPHLPFGPIIVPNLLERTISVHPPSGGP